MSHIDETFFCEGCKRDRPITDEYTHCEDANICNGCAASQADEDKEESMKSKLIKVLLCVLNSRFLNQSPCRYGYIGNVDAFSREHLAYEEMTRPGITVATILRERT